MGHVIGIDTTYTGNPVSFNAAQGGTMKSIVVPLTYSQDLHGYDHPWPAGGGVNKLDISTSRVAAEGTITQGGVTATYNADGSIRLQASTSGRVDINIFPNATYPLIVPAGTYTFSISGNEDYKQYIHLCASGAGDEYNGAQYFDVTTSATITVADGSKPWNYVFFRIFAGGSFDVTLRIQLELGSTATEWTPYENICPITGLTGLSVYRTGVNVWDEQWELGSINGSGASQNARDRIRSKNYIRVTPGATYYFYINSTYGIYAWGYDSSKTYVRRVPSNGWAISNNTVTIPSGVYYIRIVVQPRYGTTYNNDISINYPSTDTDYHAYQGTTYAVDWSTQAGTVYGGTLDVVTGQLTVDRAMVDLGTLNWSAYQTQFYAQLVNAKIPSYIEMPNAICSMFRPVPFASLTSNDNAFAINSGQSRVNIVASAYSTTAAFKTAMSGVQLVYELATPLTYQLTPKQITALIGQNYIWSSNNETLNTVLTAPATGFAGWLIKCVTNGTAVEIPLKYMRAETYTVTPDQRMEWSAERDVTGVLHRETVQNLPPKIEFNTPLMTNSDINALNNIIKAAFTNYLQRNITIQFYDPERDQYWEWDCYMPDLKYHIRNADTANNIINYEELRYAFIGY